MGRSYPRLGIEEFGRHLIQSGDLDPVYIALSKMEWSEEQRDRWLIAYWCLYHCGAASHISEFPGTEFWDQLMLAAENVEPAPTGDRWPRGHERRHWRGQQAIDACNDLRRRYSDKPEAMVDFIAHGGCRPPSQPFIAIAERVQEHRSFGPWISFKIGDMLDRLGIEQVDFRNADVFMFKDPVLAAKMFYAQQEGWNMDLVKDGVIQVKDGVIPIVVEHLENMFSDLLAPPSADRPIGLQEVETVLCKFKSHVGGHYPLFNDIDEINAGLDNGWTDVSETATMLRYYMPQRPNV